VPEEQRLSELDASTWNAMSLTEPQKHNQLHEQQVFDDKDIAQDDPVLVQVVRELGEKADSQFASLKVEVIPANIE
jgi:hypothetical protein